MKTEVAVVALASVRPNQVALRGVDLANEKFLQLKNDIASTGLLNPISVSREKDEDGSEFYSIIDGLHRYTALKTLGVEQIPVNIMSMDEKHRLVAQISGNVQRVPTKPVEYTQQLIRLLNMDSTMTLEKLAALTNQNVTWIRERLNLLRLNDDIQKAVDAGEIVLSNAFALSRIPSEMQGDLVQDAKTLATPEFASKVSGLLNKIKEDKKTGQKTDPNAFVHKAHMRKMSELTDELRDGKVGPVVVSEVVALANNATEAAEAAFQLGLKWVLHSDARSIDEQRATHESKVAARKAKNEAAKAERAAKAGQGTARLEHEVSLYKQGFTAAEVEQKMAEWDAENTAE